MRSDGISEVFSQLSTLRIVPVIRTKSSQSAHSVINALVNTGYKTAEITMSVPGAVDLIKEFGARQDLLIGAGTVMDSKQAEACIQAGAKYIISPFLADHVAELCKEANVLCLLSGLTPTEVMTAWDRGCGAVKVFPAHSMGGPGYLKSLKSVFPTIPLVPTGGVNLDNIQAYLQSGAAFVGVGGELVNIPLLEQNPEAFAQMSQKFLTAVEQTN